ncbi:flagellar basal-body MS-ring/collar protein FliF [Bacillus amyloliquefaciens]|uniref:flagellar basal-body MS-ring/collar protein FliF n=1 Tax=Bacillus amyloliquefaciens TaxID=1390 RepID=UPI002DBC4FF1|nr:flagellar basal-body MS-ring/collar protein FliF [Bacillus amyloliquefaciens]MEC3841116.1 flagellar basal-body MS-ring/collar protein FliF [Bacillus amyloliquefaciens]
MNRTLMQMKTKTSAFWNNRSKTQKILMVSGLAAFIILLIVVIIFTSSEKMVPLYKDLSAEEAGQIKEELDTKKVSSELADGGTVIMVPESQVDSLKVQLAAEGLPKTGSIDYSFFGKNAGFGLTDNEFDVLKVDATQTELSNLINEMDGIKSSKVMINMPKEAVFVGEDQPEASASIVLQIKPGYSLDQSQINGLYHLVSKSVPNLKEDNIVIMDQNSTYYDKSDSGAGSVSDSYASQQGIKSQVEKDIQKHVQSLLGTMMGQDKVVVSVTADIDFTKEKRTEDIVEPVDKDNMEGIAISAEKVAETYKGDGAANGGTAGTGSNDTANYAAANGGSNSGDYEKSSNKINYEVNRIHKEIAESPYKVRDLGIQVMVEPPNPKNAASLTAQRQADIQKILGTVVRTSLDKNEAQNQKLTNNDINNKIVVSVQPFDGKVSTNTASANSSGLPIWVYITGGVLLAAIILLIILLIRKRRSQEDEYEEYEYETPPEPVRLPDINEEKNETEETVRRKQLEKMAKEKPEDFAKLLRSWLDED